LAADLRASFENATSPARRDEIRRSDRKCLECIEIAGCTCTRDETPLYGNIIRYDYSSLDLAVTSLHAIRGNSSRPFFSSSSSSSSSSSPPRFTGDRSRRRGTIDSRAGRDYSYFSAIGLLCKKGKTGEKKGKKRGRPPAIFRIFRSPSRRMASWIAPAVKE